MLIGLAMVFSVSAACYVGILDNNESQGGVIDVVRGVQLSESKGCAEVSLKGNGNNWNNICTRDARKLQ